MTSAGNDFRLVFLGTTSGASCIGFPLIQLRGLLGRSSILDLQGETVFHHLCAMILPENGMRL